MKFRIQSKNLFLTFPKVESNSTLTDIINLIKTKEKNIKYILVSQESHKDGSTHYHIYLNYSIKKNIQSAKYYNYIFNKHGDYQKVKHIKSTINYIKKDGDFQEWGIIPTSKNDIFKDILLDIKEGHITADKVIEEDKLEITELFNKIGNLDRFERRIKQQQYDALQRSKEKIKDIDLDLFNDDFLEIMTFIKYNLNNRKFKSPMLHIWSSDTDTGKTSILNYLHKRTSTYLWPDDTWFQHYSNNLYQFILWDEFNLYGWKIPFLSKFFAGNPMSLPVKGGHAYKHDNPLIIMTSNQPLVEHIDRKYYTMGKKINESLAVKVLSTRIKEIELKKPLFDNHGSFIDIMNRSIK